MKTLFACIVLFVLLAVPSFSQLTFEKDEYVARREKLMDMIPDGMAVLRGAALSSGYNQFLQYNNLQYFCGLEIPNLILVIDGIDKTSTLFFTIDENEAKGEGIPLVLVNDPQKYTGVETCLPYDKFAEYMETRLSKSKIVYTPFYSEELMAEVSKEKTRSLINSMTEDEWDGRLIRELQFVEKLNERFPGIIIRDCFNQISDLRKIKSPAEMDIMREAGRIGVAAHLAFVKATAVNVKEIDLANLFEFTCKQEGAQGLAYNTIIMSAENMPYGHYHRYNRTLADGDFIVLDAGPDYNYYDVDFSSSIPANGKFSTEQKELYELANALREVCVKSYKPGITLGDVGQKVKEYLIKNGYDAEEPRFQGFIKYGGYNNSVGMAVHDGMGTFMGSDEVLQVGFAFACDINMYYRDIEMCIRLEDTIIITEDGCEVLSAELPRTIEEIEKIMSSNHN